MAIAGYGRLAEMLNKPKEAKKFTEMAKRMAIEWERRADDGDHYRLAFDMPGTWSQKYNFVWDKVLGLDILPDRIMKKEVAFYLKTRTNTGCLWTIALHGVKLTIPYGAPQWPTRKVIFKS